MGLLDNANKPFLMGGLNMLAASGPSLTPNSPYGGLAQGLAQGFQMDQRSAYQAQQEQYQQQQMQLQQEAAQRAQQQHQAQLAAAQQQQQLQQQYGQSFTQPQTPMAASSQAGGAQAASGTQQQVSTMKMLFPKATEAEFVTAQMMAPAEGMKYLSEAQKARNKPPAANTKLAKAKLDLQNGLISQSQYDALVKTENGGGFEGTGMDPQTYNAVVKYTLKKQNGQPTTQQEDLEYNLAHQRLSRTRTVTTPEGTYQIPGMDMSQFYNPGQQQGQPQAGQQPSSTPPAFTPKATKSVGQEATDREFAKTYAEYRAQGGRADLDKSIAQLEEVADALEGGSDTLTGPIMGNIPEGIKTAVFPESINMQNKVEEIVQRNLKIVLGSQFTEKEGEKLIARAYNPSLSEKENAKRVRSLLKTIQERRDSTEKAAKYFEENGGTLRGFNDSSSSEPKVIEYDSNGNPK